MIMTGEAMACPLYNCFHGPDNVQLIQISLVQTKFIGINIYNNMYTHTRTKHYYVLKIPIPIKKYFISGPKKIC